MLLIEVSGTLDIVETVLTESPETAAEFIKTGGIVGFPTETVYGLGANVFDVAAIRQIFEAKRRPADNPLIAHVANVEQIEELTSELIGSAKRFIDAFFPGPLTVVLNKSDRVPMIATAGLNTIGVRMPRFEVARRFIHACGTPVVAPSANLSGKPSPTTWEAVYEDLDGRIDCILQGVATEIGLESTVVDCTGDIPVLLRAGAISLEALQQIEPQTVAVEQDTSDIARSPGMRHQHYAPNARVVLIPPRPLQTDHAAYIGLRRLDMAVDVERICSTVEEYAHELFEFFRRCDRDGLKIIYCETVSESGIGAALMDRLRRASER